MGAQKPNRQRHVRVDVIAHIEPCAWIAGVQDADFYHEDSVSGEWWVK
jgi:hypothetical protein